MQDRIIKCGNCGQNFVWTESEQNFYHVKELVEPKYCLICRGVMKAAEKDNFRGNVSNKKRER